MDTDEAPADAGAAPSSNENDVNMQDAKGTTDTGGENGSAESGDQAVQMETDAKVCTGESYLHSSTLSLSQYQNRSYIVTDMLSVFVNLV